MRFYPLHQMIENEKSLSEPFSFLSDPASLTKLCACVSASRFWSDWTDIWENFSAGSDVSQYLPRMKKIFNCSVAQWSYRSLRGLGKLQLTESSYFYEVTIPMLGKPISTYFLAYGPSPILVKQKKWRSWYTELAKQRQPQNPSIDFDDIILHSMSPKEDEIYIPLPIPFELVPAKEHGIKLAASTINNLNLLDQKDGQIGVRVRIYPIGVMSIHLSLDLTSERLATSDITRLTRHNDQLLVETKDGNTLSVKDFFKNIAEKVVAGIFNPGYDDSQLFHTNSHTIVEFIEEEPPLDLNSSSGRREIFPICSTIEPERANDELISSKLGPNLSQLNNSCVIVNPNVTFLKHISRKKHYMRKIVRDTADYSFVRKVTIDLLKPRIRKIRDVYISSGITPKDRIKKIGKFSLINDARPLLMTRLILQRASRKGYGFKGHLSSKFEERIGLPDTWQELGKDFEEAMESVTSFKPTLQTILEMISSIGSLIKP